MRGLGKRHAVESLDGREQDIPPMLTGGAKGFALELVGKFVANEARGGPSESRSRLSKFLRYGPGAPSDWFRKTCVRSPAFDI